MRFVGWLVALAMTLNLPLVAAVEAHGSANELGTPAISPRSALLVDCEDSAPRAAPLAARPAPRRVSVPHRVPRKVAHAPRHKRVKVVHRSHKKVVHRKAAAKRPQRPAARRPTVAYAPTPVRRVTYAAPLCGERTPAMSAMLGLPDVTQPVVTPLDRPIEFTELTPVVGPTVVSRPPFVTDFPSIPGLPNGPGPFINPLGPPNPPIPGGGVPEPASWAMMLLGFAGIGWVARRRRQQSANISPEL